MAVYRYTARRADSGDTISGEIESESLVQAITDLEASGSTVDAITLSDSHGQQVTDAITPTADRLAKAALGQKERLVSTLAELSSDLPDGKTKRQLESLAKKLPHTTSASQLKSDPISISWLARFGDSALAEPTIASMIDAVARSVIDDDRRKQSTWVSIYPVATIVVAMIALALICWTIVPEFGEMYDEFGLVLPVPTKMLIGASDMLNAHPIGVMLAGFGVLIAAYVVFRVGYRYAFVSRFFGWFVSGNTRAVSAMARFTDHLAHMFDAGAAVPEALSYAGACCGHSHLQSIAASIVGEMVEGDSSVSDAPAARQLPANVVTVLHMASQGDPDTELLRGLSAMYRERANSRIDWSGGVASQFAVIAVGCVIAFIIVALFMPMFSLVSGLG